MSASSSRDRRQFVAFARSIVLAVVIAAGCHPATRGAATATPARRSDVLTSQDLRTATSNLYEVIQSLRPQWLRAVRYGSYDVPPVVYLDEMRW